MLETRRALCIAAMSIGVQAHGAIVCQSDSAFVQLGANLVPPDVSSGDFSVFAFIHPEIEPASSATVLEIAGVLHLGIDAGGDISWTLSRDAGVPSTLVSAISPGVATGQWLLLGASFDSAAGSLTAFVIGESLPAMQQFVSLPGFAPGPSIGDVYLGAGPMLGAGVVGAYGACAVRDHTISIGDFQDLWDSALFNAPYVLDNTSSGGALNGIPGCPLLINHGLVVVPVKGPGYSLPVEAGVIGQPVTPASFLALNPALRNDPRTTYGTPTSGFTFCSHNDPPFDGRFVADVPGTPTPSVHNVADAPNARMLADGAPCGLVRVMISANSRAVIRREQPGSTPATVVGEPDMGNYMAGFWNELRPITAGALFAPAEFSVTPQFGFNTFDNGPRINGSNISLSAAVAGPADFLRFWTNQTGAFELGPGSGTILLPGGSFALKHKPEGLALATEPLHVRAHVLRYPGSSNVTWRSAKEEAQSGATQVVGATPGLDEFTRTLDTTTYIHSLSASDSVIGLDEFVLIGDLSAQVLVGDACFFPVATSGSGAISIVQSVVFEGPNTRVTLAHNLGRLAAAGDTLRFGPWMFDTLEFDWPALGGADPMTWRGLEVECESDSLYGVVLYALSAWRPGVDGFVFGMAGWSGNGYQPQMDRSFPDVASAWIAESQADVWLQVPAQQDSTPQSLSDFADRIEAGLPDAEIVWAGESSHGSTTGIDRDFQEWHDHIAAEAPSRGYVGISIIEDPLIGTYLEQLADGMRAGSSHFSGRGNAALARAWLDALRLGARVPGDADDSGTVDIADVTFVIFRLGSTGVPGAVEGDADGDGSVTTSDIGFVIFRLGSPCNA